MSIREKLEHITSTLWVVIGLIAVSAVVLCVEFYPSHKITTWYVTNLELGTCINAKQEAKVLGISQLRTPEGLAQYEQSYFKGYRGTRTFHLPYDRGEIVEVINDSRRGYILYFSKKSACERSLESVKGGK